MVDEYGIEYYNEGVNQASIVRISLPPVHSIVRRYILVKYFRRYFRTFVVMHKKGGTELGTLYERLQKLCKAKGVSGSRMCLDLGLSKSTMSDLKYGRTKGMSAETAQKVATYFSVSVGYLLGKEDEKKPTVKDDGLSEKKKALIDFAESLSEEQAELALRLLKAAVGAE